VVPKFKMETTASIINTMTRDSWATSLDLQDAFLHVPIAKRHRKYLRFRCGNNTFQFTSLPFGLAVSPYVFTRVVKPIGAYARPRGLTLLQYLDDWALLTPSAKCCSAWTSWLVSIAEALGLLVNSTKSDLVPKRRCNTSASTSTSAQPWLGRPPTE